MSHEENLMQLEVGEELFYKEYNILRVPGGWIYKTVEANQYVDAAPSVAICFVPYYPKQKQP